MRGKLVLEIHCEGLVTDVREWKPAGGWSLDYKRFKRFGKDCAKAKWRFKI